MADNTVYITGIDKDAFDDLPPWATEDTALSIEEILKNSFSVQKLQLAAMVKAATAGGKGMSPDDVKNLSDEIEKMFKDLKAEDPKRAKRFKDDADEGKKKTKRWDQENLQFQKRLIVEALLVKAGLAIKDVFENNVKTFDALTAAGVAVTDGMTGARDGFDSIRMLAAQTGVRFTELAASIEKYSTAVNAFGLGKFAKTVGQASTGLAQFGFTAKESADLLGAQLSSQQSLGDVSRKTQAEANDDLQKFGKSVFRLSIASGVSRQAIIANVQALNQSTEANVLAGQVGEKTATSMTTFLASLKDQNLARQLLKLMSDPIKPLNETFSALQKSGMGGFAQKLAQFQKDVAGMPPELQQQALKGFYETHRLELDGATQRLALLKQAGLAEAGVSLDIITAMKQSANAIVKHSDTEIAQIEATNKASKRLQSAWESFVATFQKIFTPTIGMLNFFARVLEEVIHPIDALGKFINWFIGGTLTMLAKAFGVTEEQIKYFGDILGKVSGWFGEIADKVSNFGAEVGLAIAPWVGLGAIALAVGAGFLALSGSLKNVLGIFTGISKGKGLKGLLSTATESRAPRGAAGGGMLGGLGKGLAGLGKGIGAGLGGLIQNTLTGIATGLKALGDPKVLLGVLALAGIAGALWVAGKAVREFVGLDWETMAKAGVTLVALGAAGAAAGALAGLIIPGAIALGILGGALWIIGKAIQAVGTGIETFTKNISELSKIDGANLQAVSIGIMSLSKAMLAFIGASTVGAGASIFSTVAGGFSKLFGDGTVTDQLKIFASVGPGLQQTANALASIVASINSLNIEKTLAFGAITKNSGVSLPSPTSPIGVSAPGTPKASTLNSPSAVSTNDAVGGDQAIAKDVTQPNAAGIEKPPADMGINTALGYQSSILEQILLSTNNLVSVNKDILKYARVNT